MALKAQPHKKCWLISQLPVLRLLVESAFSDWPGDSLQGPSYRPIRV